MTRGTPPTWKRDGEWRYGPRRVILTGERPGDMAQLSETAGEDAPRPRRSVSSHDWANLLLAAGIVGILTLVAVYGPDALRAVAR